MTKMKTDLLLRAIDSLKDAPSTSARRQLLEDLERMDSFFPLPEQVTFQCTSCGSDVPVKSVTCGTCVKREPPVMVMSVDHMNADQREELLRKLEHARNAPSVILDHDYVDRLMWNPMQDIIDFHEKFGVTYDGAPRLLPDIASDSYRSAIPVPAHGNKSMAEFRRHFLKEEAAEYATATYRGNYSLHLADEDERGGEITGHLADALDAIVDTIYVALGNAYLHGFTSDRFKEAWDRVHRKNMEKVRVERAEDSKRGSEFDIIKPPGWEPADLTDLVKDHIHQTPEWAKDSVKARPIRNTDSDDEFREQILGEIAVPMKED